MGHDLTDLNSLIKNKKLTHTHALLDGSHQFQTSGLFQQEKVWKLRDAI